MDFYTNFKKAEEKLASTLLDENLVHTFSTKAYPITLIVSNDKSPGAQMEFYATAEDGKSSADAVLKLIFKLDGLKIQTDSRFVIGDALMNKIKGQAKKMYQAYLEGYFAEKSKEAADTAADPVEGDAEDFDTADEDDGADAFADFMGEAEPAEDGEDIEGEE